MAFGKTLTLMTLVSTAALATASGCSTTNETTSGDGGNTTTAAGGNGTGGNATGGNGNGGNATGGNGNGGEGGTLGAATCATYCAANVAACSGGDKQWDTANPTPEETCVAWCSLFDQGTIGDMTGDTLECRVYHTNAAIADSATHCSHAGPFGNGACGNSQCETFCEAMQLTCTGQDAQFASVAECLTDCGGLLDKDTPYIADSGSGNTEAEAFACRAYHLSAALDSPVPHCAHAAGDGSICFATP